MKNTLIKNIISNLELMDGQHFLDWFKENKLTLLEAEKRQIIEAYESCAVTTGENGDLVSIPGEEYYNETFTTNK
jgi:hypothetical protein